jgi:hypothetical protein
VTLQNVLSFCGGEAAAPSYATKAFSTTAPSAPGAVLGLRVAYVTGGSVAMEWLTPFDTGGKPITQYQIKYGGTVIGNLEPLSLLLLQTATFCCCPCPLLHPLGYGCGTTDSLEATVL